MELQRLLEQLAIHQSQCLSRWIVIISIASTKPHIQAWTRLFFNFQTFQINVIPHRFSPKYMLTCGLWCAPGKPNVQVYLRPFLDEINQLYEDACRSDFFIIWSSFFFEAVNFICKKILYQQIAKAYYVQALQSCSFPQQSAQNCDHF